MIGKNTQCGFETLNQSLKAEAEKPDPGGKEEDMNGS